MPNETTLVLLKPDCLEKNIVGDVLSRFERAGLELRAIKMLQLGEDLITEHYGHLEGQPFFPRLCEFMSSRPIIALSLEGESAISRVRNLLGPTNSQAAPAGTIRGDFGENSMFNICHASDSPETALIELKRFFAEQEIF